MKFYSAKQSANGIYRFYQVKKEQWRLQKEVVLRYYPKSFRFALCDIVLGMASLFFNAYRSCRKQGTVYGETPIASFHRIAEFCSLSKEDTWLELGSGRGKGAFWISQFVGCQTIGVENISLFVYVSRIIRMLCRVKNISFVRADMRDVDFSAISFVYLYSTSMADKELIALEEKMGALPSKSRVLTISAPLPKLEPNFRLAGSFPVSFPWGTTEAYIHERF